MENGKVIGVSDLRNP